MIVTCNHCAVRFKLDDKRVKPSGVKVRCSNCRQVFRLYPTGSTRSGVAAAAAADPAGKEDGSLFGAAAFAAGAGAKIDTVDGGTGLFPNDAARGIAGQPTAFSKDGAGDQWDSEYPEIEKMLADSPPPGGHDRAHKGVPASDQPLTLDLSDLEFASEGDEPLDSDAVTSLDSQSDSSAFDDIGLDAGSAEVEEIDSSTHFKVEDAPDLIEPAAEVESLSLSGEAGSEENRFAGEAAGRGGHEPDFATATDDLNELDPAEIEALLDLEAPPEMTASGEGDDQTADSDWWQIGDDLSDAEGVLAAPDFDDVLRTENRGDIATDEPASGLLTEDGQDLSIAGDDRDLDLTQLEKMIAEEDGALNAVALAPDEGEAPLRQAPTGGKASDAEDLGLGGDGGGLDEIDLADLDSLLDEELAAEEVVKSSSAVDAASEDRPDSEHKPELSPAAAEIEDALQGGAPGKEPYDLAALDSSPAELAEDALEHVIDDGEDFSSVEDEDALDFSDLEKLLEEELDAEESPPDELPEDLELELNLDMPDGAAEAEYGMGAPSPSAVEKRPAPRLSATYAGEAKGSEENYELERIDTEFDGSSVILDGADGLELETLANYEDLETVAAEAIDRLDEKGSQSDEAFAEEIEMAIRGKEEPILEEPEEAAAAAIPMMPASRKTVRTPLVVLLVLTIIGAGVYAAYTMIDWSKIQIPFVSQFFKQAPPDGDDLYNIAPLNVQSRFVSNSVAGTLLVISGRAKNDYDHPRSYIRIKGTLIDLEGNPLKEQMVFCGNSISDEELESLDMTAIGKRLNRRAGSNRTNVKVPAGRSIPFMLVFSDLPANLGEYAVAPAGSVSAK